jgi:hypothetical protein
MPLKLEKSCVDTTLRRMRRIRRSIGYGCAVALTIAIIAFMIAAGRLGHVAMIVRKSESFTAHLLRSQLELPFFSVFSSMAVRKQITGRKRHLVFDTLGLVLAVVEVGGDIELVQFGALHLRLQRGGRVATAKASEEQAILPAQRGTTHRAFQEDPCRVQFGHLRGSVTTPRDGPVHTAPLWPVANLDGADQPRLPGW